MPTRKLPIEIVKALKEVETYKEITNVSANDNGSIFDLLDSDIPEWDGDDDEDDYL